jgi:hypothetical protein
MNYMRILNLIRSFILACVSYIIMTLLAFSVLMAFLFASYLPDLEKAYPNPPLVGWPGHGISTWKIGFDYAQWYDSLKLDVQEKRGSTAC